MLRCDGVVIDTLKEVTQTLRAEQLHDPVAVNEFVTAGVRIIRDALPTAMPENDMIRTIAEVLNAGSDNYFELATDQDRDPYLLFRDQLAQLAASTESKRIPAILPKATAQDATTTN